MANFNAQELLNAWNTNSADKVAEFYAENAEIVTPEAQGPLRGKRAIRENVEGWLKAFPDATGDLEKTLVSGQEVALLIHFHGTNRGAIELGPGRSLPATNKKVDMQVCIFATLDAHGKIVRERDVYDTGAYFQQLGVSPEQMATLLAVPSGTSSSSSRTATASPGR